MLHSGHPAPPPPPRPPAHRAAAAATRRLAGRISLLARSLRRTANRLYYRANPRKACASFVSTVLIRAGAMLRSRFTRSAASLPGVLARSGAHQVLPYGTRITPAVVAKLLPGDVIMFHHPGRRLSHSGVVTGRNRFVAISSSRRVVVEYDLLRFRSSFRCIRVYRFPR
jgi:hypothetical protein